MAASMNVSPIILQCYPETSPWDLQPPVFSVTPAELVPCRRLPESAGEAALKQAMKTKLNPFHFMCWSNPYILNHPTLDKTYLPFAASPQPVNVPNLPHYTECSNLFDSWEELHVVDGIAVRRLHPERASSQNSRVLKLVSSKPILTLY
ncbi:hypothetical protein BN946_scf184970.g58 [Trametes cinnabarina]|uniref:Uncharacterized protein n=1 Tax=Pycnoporus cinnabarinus TaxID=5643 RepID=A0A060SDA0_PYCCI|nr:hypothetical protein BN946_scf184970.g58 [Trametes cinnabarina]